MKQANKMVIYQVFPRWFGNMKSSLVKNGSKVENGVGKVFGLLRRLLCPRLRSWEPPISGIPE